MKKSHQLGAVCAATMLAVISTANAELIAADDTYITSTDQPHDLTPAVSPSLASDVVLTTDIFGAIDKTQTDRGFNNTMGDISPTSPQTNAHTNSHMDLWLLLIVAAVVSILSEIFHKRNFHR